MARILCLLRKKCVGMRLFWMTHSLFAFQLRVHHHKAPTTTHTPHRTGPPPQYPLISLLYTSFRIVRHNPPTVQICNIKLKLQITLFCQTQPWVAIIQNSSTLKVHIATRVHKSVRLLNSRGRGVPPPGDDPLNLQRDSKRSMWRLSSFLNLKSFAT